jgi:hypothetical protein
MPQMNAHKHEPRMDAHKRESKINPNGILLSDICVYLRVFAAGLLYFPNLRSFAFIRG